MNPLIKSVDQIGFVVRDLDATVRLLADKYGIGPWMILKFGDPEKTPGAISVEDTVLDGKPLGTYSTKCAVCDMPSNGVQLELIQPLDDKSMFAQYLEEHGPGLQHISVVTNDGYEEAMERIIGAGFYNKGQTATFGGAETCTFADFRRLLGSYLELHKRPENFEIPNVTPEFYPPSGEMPKDAVPMFSEVEQLGIVVKDLDEAVRILNDEFGLGPWIFLKFGYCEDGDDNHVEVGDCVNDGNYIGKFGIRAAICEQLNIQLELLQPVTPGTSLAVHMEKNGDDVHHLSLVHEEYEKAVSRIKEAGFTGGQTCTIDITETCFYSDHLDPLGLFLELHKRPENFEPPAIRLETYPPGLDIRFGE